MKRKLTQDEIEEKARLKKEIDELSLPEKFNLYQLAIKYYLSGDDWDFAKGYALPLVKGFKR